MSVQDYLANPFRLYSYLTYRGGMKWIPDKLHLKLMMKAMMGKWANLDAPVSFNEKLQWLKLHDHNPLYTRLVDKYNVKEWVADRIGSQYVPKTFARWDRIEEIDISNLPDRFVLKTNHDCGGIAICSDRKAFDLDGAKRKLAEHLRCNYFWGGREWPYKDVEPCIIAEEYLEPNVSGDLLDYKFMCFDGRVRCAFTCTGRAAGDLRVDFFDTDWSHLPFTRHYPNADEPPERPRRLEEMIEFAERLSKGIPFVRVDFYEQGDRVLFGEMTFYPGSGFEEFAPEEWDEKLGSWIELPMKERYKID